MRSAKSSQEPVFQGVPAQPPRTEKKSEKQGTPLSQSGKEPKKKPGLFSRVLGWIAKGSEKASKSNMLCRS